MLKTLPDESVQCCVTSPPYWGLRDYGVAGQLGLEKTPEEYVARMVEVFREVRRCLRSDGVAFVNLGDSYSSLTLGVLRIDLNDEEYEAGLQIVWETLGQTERKRILSSLLPEALEKNTPREGAGVGPQLLSPEQDGFTEADSTRTQEPALENDSGLGGKVRVLRRNGDGVSLFGSHQRKRQAGLSEEGRSTRSLEASNSRGTSEGQIPDSLLELQLSARSLRLLSTREIDLASIPSKARRYFQVTLKPKDLVGIPWRVAFALQADGWWLRQDIIWSKPNPMPESVTDRCTKAHEYIFLLTKSARYFYDAEAIKEPSQEVGTVNSFGNKNAAARLTDELTGNMRPGVKYETLPNRNKRSVWTIPSAPYIEAHFATFPPDLIKPCILAGSKPGDTILDPFGGSGTTGMVALELGRKALLIELNPEYVKLAESRCFVTHGLAL